MKDESAGEKWEPTCLDYIYNHYYSVNSDNIA